MVPVLVMSAYSISPPPVELIVPALVTVPPLISAFERSSSEVPSVETVPLCVPSVLVTVRPVSFNVPPLIASSVPVLVTCSSMI